MGSVIVVSNSRFFPEEPAANYVTVNATAVSYWLVVAAGIDRLLVVYYPMKAAIYSSKKRAIYVASALFIGIPLSNLHMLFCITKVTFCE